MPTITLTDLSIRSLKCETRTDYWDAKTAGVRHSHRPAQQGPAKAAEARQADAAKQSSLVKRPRMASRSARHENGTPYEAADSRCATFRRQPFLGMAAFFVLIRSQAA
jgi:hypothetical protein